MENFEELEGKIITLTSNGERKSVEVGVIDEDIGITLVRAQNDDWGNKGDPVVCLVTGLGNFKVLFTTMVEAIRTGHFNVDKHKPNQHTPDDMRALCPFS